MKIYLIKILIIVSFLCLSDILATIHCDSRYDAPSAGVPLQQLVSSSWCVYQLLEWEEQILLQLMQHSLAATLQQSAAALAAATIHIVKVRCL